MLLKILAVLCVMMVYVILGVAMILYADHEAKKAERVVNGEDRGE